MWQYIVLHILYIASYSRANYSSSSCEVYTNQTDNCAQSNCGRCFNPGGRTGVMCLNSGGSGYYCAADSPSYSDQVIAFACMDWTFGSQSLKKAEESFNSKQNENVYFGFGTFGTSSDLMRGLGICYRMSVEGVDKDLIVQSINTGSDVAGNQFDLQVGNGGTGAFNNCAGKSWSMYPDGYDWGQVYGGSTTRQDCSKLPLYPQKSGPMTAAGDDLQTLCEYSFDKHVRGPNGENPTIRDLGRVQCPKELVEFSQLLRNDDPMGYKITTHNEGFPNMNVKCGQQSNSFCLTRMMDCRKPSAGFIDNIKEGYAVSGKKVLQPCTSDGYSRIDVQCGCTDCYC